LLVCRRAWWKLVYPAHLILPNTNHRTLYLRYTHETVYHVASHPLSCKNSGVVGGYVPTSQTCRDTLSTDQTTAGGPHSGKNPPLHAIRVYGKPTQPIFPCPRVLNHSPQNPIAISGIRPNILSDLADRDKGYRPR